MRVTITKLFVVTGLASLHLSGCDSDTKQTPQNEQHSLSEYIFPPDGTRVHLNNYKHQIHLIGEYEKTGDGAYLHKQVQYFARPNYPERLMGIWEETFVSQDDAVLKVRNRGMSGLIGKREDVMYSPGIVWFKLPDDNNKALWQYRLPADQDTTKCTAYFGSTDFDGKAEKVLIIERRKRVTYENETEVFSSREYYKLGTGLIKEEEINDSDGSVYFTTLLTKVEMQPKQTKATHINQHETGSSRKAILDALRKPVEAELNQHVKFVVRSLEKCGGYALIFATPVNESGGEIDYSKTQYQRFIDDGVFDEGVLALLREEGGGWTVAGYAIGGTDSPIEEWISKHQLEPCRKQFGFTE